jgi:hypothetical protein
VNSSHLAYISHPKETAKRSEEAATSAPAISNFSTKGLRYEPGLIVAEGDYVIVHGRFSGRGSSVNWIAADIARIENGFLQEHWDVLQDEVTEGHSKEQSTYVRDEFPEM